MTTGRITGEGRVKRNRAVFARDGYRCRKCGMHGDGVPGALVVDHVIPYAITKYDPPHVHPNLQTLCITCHKAKSHEERSARAYRPKYRANGLPRN